MQKSLIAALGGLVAGVAVGLLLAPKKGSETRNDIASGVKNKWKKVWGKDVAEDDDPWAAYNARKAAQQNA